MTTNMLTSVDTMTNIAGENRMEMLMFRLQENGQLYGINVFKVREVTQCPKLTHIPRSKPCVPGVVHFRGVSIPVIDFSLAIGGPAIDKPENCLVIISEYNLCIQALLVAGVERIVNLKWDKIKTPPAGSGSVSGSYVTAVTEVDGKLVEIIDVERIVEEISPTKTMISDNLKEEITDVIKEEAKKYTILLADDSIVALKNIKLCLDSVGVNYVSFADGKQALEHLKELIAEGKNIYEEFLMVISDVEMPDMDGYTLTTEIRFDPNMKDLFIVLHTSLSGVFNESLVKKVGADRFIAKFQSDLLADVVLERIKEKENIIKP